eukprot:g1435.t1
MSGESTNVRRHTTMSLRAELNEEEKQRYNEYVKENLQAKQRDELEAEIRKLRHRLFTEDMKANRELRDMLSHAATGKTHDMLHVNQTPETGHEDEKDKFKHVMEKALRRAAGGGLSGSMAMVLTIGTLMWLRTTMNYQYRHGTSTLQALKHLYKEGGVPRFYKGVGFALIQGPMSRFGDTAANAGVLAFMDSYDSTRKLNSGLKTMCASTAAASWRILLMPVDACKTVMQVEGSKGLGILANKVKLGGPTVLWHGAFGAFGATWMGHYPWFFTHNTLQEVIPKQDGTVKKFARNGFIGFCSSFVSDCCSNSIRVVKTTKQTFERPIGYVEVVKHIVAQDGVTGLFFRGLGTRILANGFQSMMFTACWKGMDDYMRRNQVGFYSKN